MKKILLISILLFIAGFALAQNQPPVLPAQPQAQPQAKLIAPDQDTSVPAQEHTEESGAQAEKQLNAMFEAKNPLISVITESDKARITIGEKIIYRIKILAEKDIKIEFPDFGESLGGFAITDFKVTGPDKQGDLTSWMREYTLDVYLSGKYVIPPAKITYKLSNGEPQTIFTAPVFVEVKSILPDENAKLRDIKQPVAPELKISKKIIVLIVVCVILLIGAAVAVYLWWMKRKNYIPPPRPAHLIALEALKDIKSRGLIESGQIKEFYFLVSNVLRHYIENRFGLMAPERTTDEFLIELNDTNILELKHKDILRKFLTHCDMVKFAKYAPVSDEIEQAYVTAEDFVNETKPVLTETQAEDEDYTEDEEEE